MTLPTQWAGMIALGGTFIHFNPDCGHITSDVKLKILDTVYDATNQKKYF